MSVHLLVGVTGERYALPVDAVREVARIEAPSPLPGAAAALLGLVGIRGEVVPVFDTAAIVGAPGAVVPRLAVVIDVGGTRAALAVDEVVDVTELGGEIERAELSVLAGSTVLDDRLVGVVDPDALVAAVVGEQR